MELGWVLRVQFVSVDSVKIDPVEESKDRTSAHRANCGAERLDW